MSTDPTHQSLPHLERRLRESLDAFWDRLVDPQDALFDADGLRWNVVGYDFTYRGPAGLPFATEIELREIRNQCRALAATNEFAMNGIENRISYIVGTGHAYRAVPRELSIPPDLAPAVQAVLDEFVKLNKWHQRQQEIVRRKDRDGECFLRLFPDDAGTLRVRFVEPEQVATPPEQSADPSAQFGILTDPQDVETVRGYYVDGQLLPAEAIQHRKANVDANVKRGLPLFFPVRKNLRHGIRTNMPLTCSAAAPAFPAGLRA